MRRRRTVVAVLALASMACGGPDRAAEQDPTAGPGSTHAAPITEAAPPPDGPALVMAWTEEATLAARNGPTVLLRFAAASRQPGLDSDPDCIPAFTGTLRQDAEALVDASVTRQDDGTYLVRGVDLRVDVAVQDGRAGHLDACGGPVSLRAEAEQEERERAAAQAAEEARAAAEQAAAQAAAEQAAREEEEREAAAQRAAADAEAATPEDGLPGDEPVDGRVEVFPRDRTPPPAG